MVINEEITMSTRAVNDRKFVFPSGVWSSHEKYKNNWQIQGKSYVSSFSIVQYFTHNFCNITCACSIDSRVPLA